MWPLKLKQYFAIIIHLLLVSIVLGDYTIFVQNNESDALTVNPGDSFNLDIRLETDNSDIHDSAIFRLVFSKPGLEYLSYYWSSPYPNETDDDDSTPIISDLPIVIKADSLAGIGYPSNTVDIELSNSADTDFNSGLLVKLTLKVPESWQSIYEMMAVSIIPDTLADGFRVINSVSGSPMTLKICPKNLSPFFYVDDDSLNDPVPGDPDQSDPFEDGTMEHPYDSVQKAINAISSGKSIVLLPGYYTGKGNRDIDLQGKSLIIRSQDPNDPEAVLETIIDCHGTETEPHRAFVLEGNPDTTLDGLTLKNGFASSDGGSIYCADSRLTIQNCYISNNNAYARGGAIHLDSNSQLIISKSQLSANCAYRGGAISNYDSELKLFDCLLEGNSTAINDDIGTSNNGGAIINIGSSDEDQAIAELVNCAFIRNSSIQFGGVMTSYRASIDIDHCTFLGNQSLYGGVMDNSRCQVSLVNSFLTGNSAQMGGAIFCYASELDINHTVLTGNQADQGGGLFVSTDSSVTMDFCTCGYNRAREGAGIYFDLFYPAYPDPSQLKISNSILWDEGTEIVNNNVSSLTIDYSDVKGEYSGMGNLQLDPQFADSGLWQDVNNTPDDLSDDSWLDGDYHLKSTVGRWDPMEKDWVIDDELSPCIDAGNPKLSPGNEIQPNGGLVNIGAYGGTSQASQSLQEILYVDNDAPDDPGPDDPNRFDPLENGTLAHPFDTIQKAINYNDGEQCIIILPGIYTGIGNRDIDLQGKSLIIRSQEPNDPEVVLETIIDCQGTETEPHRAFVIEGNPDTILNGLTLKNGFSSNDGGSIRCADSYLTIQNCYILNNNAYARGGAIHLDFNSQLTISKSQLSANRAYRGGAISNYDSELKLFDCLFEGNNTAINEALGTSNNGGAIISIGPSDEDRAITQLVNCVFNNNSSIQFGGVMTSYRASIDIDYCTFQGNQGLYGGVMDTSRCQVSLVNSFLTGNRARMGGAIFCYASELDLQNTILAGNYADQGGGLFVSTDSNITIDFCTCVLNRGQEGGGICCDRFYPAYPDPSQVKVSNSIFWDDGTEIVNNNASFLIIEYSDIQGGYPGMGNMQLNPQFADSGLWQDVNNTPDDLSDDSWLDGDYHLKSTVGRWDPMEKDWVINDELSPCIDAGNPKLAPGNEIQPNGGLVNIGANGGTDQASLSTGILPDDTVDFNKDGLINLGDFIFLSEQWLNQATCCIINNWCSGLDLNRSKDIDALDLSLMAEEWLRSKFVFIPGSTFQMGDVPGDGISNK